MSPTIDPKITEDLDLRTKVEHATELLVEQLGPASRDVRVAWEKGADVRGRDVLRLTLSDWNGSVGYPFVRNELGNDEHLRQRFHRLWGDFLQVRSHTQLDSPLYDPAVW
jgi:hypothetical protein